MRDGKNPDARSPEGEVRARVQHWQAQAALGIWPLVAFAAVSLWAVAGFPGLPHVPEGWNEVLGRPPPPSWVNAAFVLYIFSALILSLTRMGMGTPAKVSAGFAHVGYLAAFYGFYALAGVLADNVWAVLVGGFAVLTLEWYRGWLYCRERARDENPGADREGPTR
ncbi:MAG: menaquinol oxidoreductase [Proteobacteria bacterium]|nr:menaquinol oxidoreductase [Pseudomonadota bacterium]